MLKDRFRKFLPVVVDLETGGFDAVKNPILEIAIQLIDYQDDQLVLGQLHRLFKSRLKSSAKSCG